MTSWKMQNYVWINIIDKQNTQFQMTVNINFWAPLLITQIEKQVLDFGWFVAERWTIFQADKN